MTCKETSTIVATSTAPLRLGLMPVGVWVHLAMCRHCRAYLRGLDRIARLARRIEAANTIQSEKD